MTPEEIRRALAENYSAPYGSVRSSRAEELAAAAETCGDAALYREALSDLVEAYVWSSERPRATVPFARLLQEYDREPTAFEQWEAHSLLWSFKWVTNALIDSPEVPIETVDRWLADMEHRYRVAGHGDRAVRQCEYQLASSAGDEQRAARTFAAWTATERDRMANCHACELGTQGSHWARTGENAKALDVWEPVIAGRNTCKEEPHRVLADSLIPLLRLGRLDQARTHHLRGYRLVRGEDSLLRSVGKHIEFCALSGNEPRGVEILAEHASHLGPKPDLDAQLGLTGGALVLLRRLVDLGHGDRPTVPYQGEVRTAHDLYELLHAEARAVTARFDSRNGNDHTSDEFAERIGRQPLVDTLPLGVRSAALPASATVRPASATVRSSAAADEEKPAALDELITRARDLRSQGHPGTGAAWERVAARVEADGTDPDPGLAADLLEHRALSAAQAGVDDARTLIAASADAHRDAGQHGRAVLAKLRAVTAAATFGAEPGEIRDLLEVAVRAADALDDADPERPRRVATAELTRIRIEAYLRARATHAAGDQHPTDGDPVFAEELARFAADRVADGEQAHLVAQAETILAQLASEKDEPARAEELLTSAADRCVAAGCVWEAVEPLARRAGLLFARGEAAEAEASARSAVRYAAELTDPEEQAAVRLTLAEVLLRRGEHPEEAVSYALEAAHWFDQAGLSETGGAQARQVLARSYAAAGRTAEAAEVLQSALPDLLEHGEPHAVSARETLGDLLLELHDPRGAAEQYLRAADIAKSWDDPRPQAKLAHGAAEALTRAGLRGEAEAAYGRSLDLWRRAGGNPVAEARVLRSLAWLAVGDEDDEDDAYDGCGEGEGEGEDGGGEESAEKAEADLARGRASMREALDVLAGDDRPHLRYERGQTWQQLAEMLVQHVEMHLEDAEYPESDSDTATSRTPAAADALRLEAVDLWARAAEVYDGLGPDALRERFQCLNRAAWTERALGRVEAAVARMESLAADLEGREEAKDLLTVVRQVLDRLRS